MLRDPKRNVGTASTPVSWLHERAVALLYDEIKPFAERYQRSYGRGSSEANHGEEIRVQLSPDGTLSNDLLAGVAEIRIPGEWDNVGGIVPDLICYGKDGNPIRLIEVVVASPPNREKQTKLSRLKQRGLDVVLVEIKSEQDLLNMVHLDSQAEFRRPANYVYKRNLASDVKVQELLGALTSCSPRLRRELALVLAQLETLDSLHPLNQQNPLTDKLGE